MNEKLMIYVFARTRIVIDPRDPAKPQPSTITHCFPVPAEEWNDPDFVLLDRYCFCSVPSEVKEELAAQGFDRELSWDVVEIITPTPEEWDATQAEVVHEAMKMPSGCRLAGPLCPPSDPDPVDEAAADRAASCVILGNEFNHRVE